jgi:transcriptional regulator with GAF, ATPase, and Fis domain
VETTGPEPSAFDRIALAMTSTLDLGEVLTAVTRGLVDELGVALARVWLVELADRSLRLRASSGLSTRLDGRYARVPIGAFEIGRIAETAEPVWTNDVLADDRIADHDWAKAHGLQSFAGLPLRFRGQLLGVLATFTRHPLDDAVRGRLALFANQAAIAIQNAHLFSEVRALEERLKAENAYLRREISGEEDASAILARSPGLAGVLVQVEQVAPTSTTVLLLGETGTGKELLARAIHERSDRRGGPLVRVNCAALSPALVESELFGHERGAFTGALQRRVGRFELADGGTLVLDEVGEIPLEAQPKLLRVLQEREIERVGGAQPVHVDVRIVAATNRDLSEAVAAGLFRADLFYRLAVFPIEVPPLRARRSDIVPLAERFLVAQSGRLGRAPAELDAGARQRLVAYDWPGNVRELANVIERAAIVTRGSKIGQSELFATSAAARGREPAEAESGRRAVAKQSAATANEEDAAPSPSPAAGDDRLSSIERAHVLRVLERTGWAIEGKGGAAGILGLAPSTLRSRMAQLGIRRPGTKAR